MLPALLLELSYAATSYSVDVFYVFITAHAANKGGGQAPELVKPGMCMPVIEQWMVLDNGARL